MSETTPEQGAASRPKLLVVDDDPTCLAVVRETLEPRYAVLTATTGAEALFLARMSKPRLVLLDLDLPGVDGAEVARELRSTPETSSIVIVAFTGMSRVPAAPFDAFIFKPFRPAQLLASIEALGP